MGSLANMFTKPTMLYSFLAVLLIIVIGLLVLKWLKPSLHEGFYPLDDARKTLGDIAMHRYNDFADTQDFDTVHVIPEGPEGEPILNKLLDTPAYAADGTPAGTRKQAASLNYNDERTNIGAPDIPILIKRIKMCEAVTSWDCEALSRPDFKQYCGICTVK